MYCARGGGWVGKCSCRHTMWVRIEGDVEMEAGGFTRRYDSVGQSSRGIRIRKEKRLYRGKDVSEWWCELHSSPALGKWRWRIPKVVGYPAQN
jgi:hypothetical protein